MTLHRHSPLVIGVCGAPAVGKDTLIDGVSDSLATSQQLLCQTLRFSDPLRAIISAVDSPGGRHIFESLTFTMKEYFGDEVLTAWVRDRTLKSGADIVWWNGIRSHEDIQALRSLPGSVLCEIIAPVEVALERLQRRCRDSGDQAMTAAEYASSESVSMNLSAAVRSQEADWVINNSIDGQQTEAQNALIACIKSTWAFDEVG